MPTAPASLMTRCTFDPPDRCRPLDGAAILRRNGLIYGLAGIAAFFP
jgi:hypothetical protein